ncbi:MAG: hemY [Planctomycetaceae bacterium]|nr:hemY [Planctomycetaceae bacterium]
MNRSLRIAVVGGGITGLAAAHRLVELGHATPPQITLFEASPRLGGLVATQQIQGYTLELGPDSFITNKPWAVDLCRRLGLEEQLIPTDPQYRRSFVLRRGKPVVVPDGFQLMTPARIWPVLTSSIFSWWGKLRMGCEYFLPARRDVIDESLASFVRRRFGQEVLERLVQPLVGGIYTSDPEKLSLRATLPRFLDMEQRFGSLIRASRAAAKTSDRSEQASGARYGLFATHAGGTAQIVQALASKISDMAEVITHACVTQVEPLSSGGYRLTCGASSREFDRVIFTIPTYQIADLVEPFATKFAQALREIEYASTTIVVSGHKFSDVRHPLDAFGLVVPAIEKRRILAVSFTSRKFPNRAPDGCVQLRTFVGGAMQPELFLLSDDETKQLVREELRDLLGVGGVPDFEVIARYPRSMPQYHVGHIDRVARIRELGRQYPGIFLAGSAYDGVGLPDSIHSGELAAESGIQSKENETVS